MERGWLAAMSLTNGWGGSLKDKRATTPIWEADRFLMGYILTNILMFDRLVVWLHRHVAKHVDFSRATPPIPLLSEKILAPAVTRLGNKHHSWCEDLLENHNYGQLWSRGLLVSHVWCVSVCAEGAKWGCPQEMFHPIRWKLMNLTVFHCIRLPPRPFLSVHTAVASARLSTCCCDWLTAGGLHETVYYWRHNVTRICCLFSLNLLSKEKQEK